MESVAALAIVRAVQIPLALLALLNKDSLWPPEPIVKNNTCFDYIIVGGGSAGMVVASRMSENSKFNILVLEAGGNPPLEALLALLFVLEPETYLDYNYTSTYDPYAANSQPGNVTKLTSGKMLGGSSCMNHFIHVRGATEDFNHWADIVNDDSWNYENVLPYFIKSEHLKDPVVENSRYGEYHGYDGPMGVARQPSLAANNYLAAFGELGNRIVVDVNGPDTLGYTQSMLILTDSVRQCTSYTYIRPVRTRPNLYVLRHAYVTKIIIDENNRAVAVEVVIDNKKYIYRASREIIVSAGVFKTPQILMLSGIGPKEHLESFNIPVKADLPVGDNWQEHLAVSIVHRMDQSIVDPVIPLPTIIPFPILVGLVSLNDTQTYGDYQVFGLILGKDTPYLILACAVVFGFRPEICDKYKNQVIGYNSLYSLITLINPSSRGKIRMKSADPFADPEITTGFYDKEDDLHKMVAFVKDYIRVSNTTFFTQVNAKLLDLDLIECKDFIYGSDEFWRCYILHTTVSTYHSTSTCPMGTVLNSCLKVYNIKSLRVVDASAMPTVPRGNPLAAVIMIAEKASDMIKADAYRYPSCKDLKDCVCNIRLPEQRDNCTMAKEKQDPLERL